MADVKDKGAQQQIGKSEDCDRERRIERMKPDRQDRSNLGGDVCDLDELAAEKEKERES